MRAFRHDRRRRRRRETPRRAGVAVVRDPPAGMRDSELPKLSSGPRSMARATSAQVSLRTGWAEPARQLALVGAREGAVSMSDIAQAGMVAEIAAADSSPRDSAGQAEMRVSWRVRAGSCRQICSRAVCKSRAFLGLTAHLTIVDAGSSGSETGHARRARLLICAWPMMFSNGT